jgi:hypothetical protein
MLDFVRRTWGSAMETSSTRAGRTLHLVDLENLTGGGAASGDALLGVLDDYLDVAEWNAGDCAALAANPSVVRKIAFDLPVPCNIHAVCGADSADLMLLSLAPPELVTRRYGRLVVGSGDGIFARRAAQARAQGVHVDVVTRPESCSTRLLTFEPRWLFVDVDEDAAHEQVIDLTERADNLVTAA